MHPSVAHRAERRQADSDRMGEGRLRLAASPGRAESQAGPLAVAQRAGGCKPVRQPRERGRRGRDAGGISRRTTLGGSGD